MDVANKIIQNGKEIKLNSETIYYEEGIISPLNGADVSELHLHRIGNLVALFGTARKEVEPDKEAEVGIVPINFRPSELVRVPCAVQANFPDGMVVVWTNGTVVVGNRHSSTRGWFGITAIWRV